MTKDACERALGRPAEAKGKETSGLSCGARWLSALRSPACEKAVPTSTATRISLSTCATGSKQSESAKQRGRDPFQARLRASVAAVGDGMDFSGHPALPDAGPVTLRDCLFPMSGHCLTP
jgi:hypothetical protein